MYDNIYKQLCFARSLEPVCGLLSNSEVLQVLYDRGADGQRPGSRALPSEKLVRGWQATTCMALRAGRGSACLCPTGTCPLCVCRLTTS